MSSEPSEAWRTRKGHQKPESWSNIASLLNNTDLMERWRVARIMATEKDEGAKRVKITLTRRDDPTLKMIFVLIGSERMQVQSARLFRGNRILSYKEVMTI